MHFLIPGIEIALISTVVYYLLSFFWNTRALDIIYASLGILALFVLSRWLQLPVIQKLLFYVINMALLALLIIFQPEIRMAISRVGIKGKKYQEASDFDKFVESLAQSIYRLAERRIGALVILENQDSLEDLANRSVLVQAQFSPELLESIFITTTPLHDGAVIIRGTTILSAASILPLADDSAHVSKSMGTRHRAALGISQLTDSLAIVVSEETGKVSIARDGIMTRGVKIDRFKGIIRSVFTPPKTDMVSQFNVLEQFKQIWNR